jgi:hypothetical protein
MVEEYFNGRMERFMMVSGKMDIKLEVECGPIFKDKVIWVNGKMTKFKVLESLLWKMVQDIKVNLKTLLNMERGPKGSLMVKHMLEIMRKTGQTVKDNTIGRMETTTKEVFWMD